MRSFLKIGVFVIAMLAIFECKAQVTTKKRHGYHYLENVRYVADSMANLSPSKNARLYYFQLTKAFYEQTLSITKEELRRQKENGNQQFLKAMLTLLLKLQADLKSPFPVKDPVPLSPFFQQNTKAALGNFNRYKQPTGLSLDRQYLWVMIQVFENINQINIGYLQLGLPQEEKAQVWQRVSVQQKICDQLKSKYAG